MTAGNVAFYCLLLFVCDRGSMRAMPYEIAYCSRSHPYIHLSISYHCVDVSDHLCCMVSVSVLQILMSSSAHTASTSCCETGRPIMTDPHTGQTVCSCQYTSSLLNYPRVAGLPESVYGSPYAAAAAAQTYVPGLGADPSAFYPLVRIYDYSILYRHDCILVHIHVLRRILRVKC